MNVYDTKSGKPCIQLQFVECSFRDGPAGDEVPLSLGFMFPTQVTHTCWPALVLCSLGDMPSDFDCASCQTLGHDRWNLKFQLNYKKHPVRAVQVNVNKSVTMFSVMEMNEQSRNLLCSGCER